MQVRHRCPVKDWSGHPGKPSCPERRARHSSAIRSEAGVSIHLPIELGHKNKYQSSLPRNAAGTCPDRSKAVETVPCLLGAMPNLPGGHYGVGCVQLRS